MCKDAVPLIKRELELGERAGVEHYRRAGFMLIEAKEQVPEGEWERWLEANVEVSVSQAQRYMQLARRPANAARRAASIRQAVPQGGSGEATWEAPVREELHRVDVLARAQLPRPPRGAPLYTPGANGTATAARAPGLGVPAALALLRRAPARVR